MKWMRCAVLLLLFPALANAATAVPPATQPLPEQTSRYNKGDTAGRYRDADHKLKRFTLKHATTLYDGGGRDIGKIEKPLLLNVGAEKQMTLEGKSAKQSFAWAWNTEAGSGWVARDDLIDPPPPEVDAQRNPVPPHDADTPLTIDCAAGREKLTGLVHANSEGVLPNTGGNKGEHYAGRNPGPRDYVYLLFASPNVQRGGVAKDSLPNGSRFIPALDENKNPIEEVMTMYIKGDAHQPVRVTFLYGRAENNHTYGWLARANVGER